MIKQTQQKAVTSEKKFLNNWIKSNFSGLGTISLLQVLNTCIWFNKTDLDNIVFCTLFNYATGKDKTDDTKNLVDTIKEIVTDYLQFEN